MTIREAVAECLKRLANKKSKNTVRTYAAGLDEFLTYLGDLADRPVEELTARHFIEYLEYLIQRYESKRTAVNREASAKHLRMWLVLKHYLEWNAQNEAEYSFAKRDAFSERSYAMPKIPKEEDIEKLISFVSEMDTFYPIEQYRNVAIVHLLASSGIRVSEAASLLVGDIDLEKKKVHVKKAKGKKEFRSPISDKAVEAIKFYWDARRWSEPNQPAFARHDKQVGKKKVSVTAGIIQRIIRELGRQAGIENITPHKFRHYVGTRVTKKMGIRMAQEWLHHSSSSTTEGYAHYLEDDIMEANKTMWD